MRLVVHHLEVKPRWPAPCSSVNGRVSRLYLGKSSLSSPLRTGGGAIGVAAIDERVVDVSHSSSLSLLISMCNEGTRRVLKRSQTSACEVPRVG